MARPDNYDPVTNETDVYYQYQPDAILQESVTILPAAGSSNITTIIAGGGGSVTGPTTTLTTTLSGLAVVAAGTTLTLQGTLGLTSGGTGAITATGARTNLGIITYVPNLTPVSVAANTSAEEAFAVAGLTTSDTVYVDGPAPTAGTGIVGFRVSGANTLAINFGNFTAGALIPAAGVYRVVAIRA